VHPVGARRRRGTYIAAVAPEAVEGSQSSWLVSSLLSLQAATLRLAGAGTVAETADVLLQEAAPVTDA
jgi:hypothetical protein